jgi:biotin carboxyl carrier protein
MRITVQIKDKFFEIDIQKLPFELTINSIMVDGKPVDIAISPDWAQQFSKCLIVGDRSYQVEFEHDAMDLPRRIWAVGQSVDVKVDFPGKGKLNRPEMTGLWGTGNQVRAPLPGKVTKVLVQKGQEVKAGEILGLLEAMKMENELHCPRNGIVSEVLVSECENVVLDQVLITLE